MNIDTVPVASIDPEPTLRVEPHVRGKHARVVNGKEIPVRASIVNLDGARRQQRLGPLTRALQIAQNEQVRHRASVVPADPGSRQLDLLVEMARSQLARGEKIMTEGVSMYARLTPSESGLLAMARVNLSIHESLDRANEKPSTAYMREDLARLENMLFAASLTRLSPEDSAAFRTALDARTKRRQDAEAQAAAEAVHDAHEPVGHDFEADEPVIERERARG